jgi:hypothetical protein
MHEINLLCSGLGVEALLSLLDSLANEVTRSQLSGVSDLHLFAQPSTPPPGMEEVPVYLAGFAECDESLLDEEPEEPNTGSTPAAGAAAAAAAGSAAAAAAAAAAPATAADVAAAAQEAAAALLTTQLASLKRGRSKVSSPATAAVAAAKQQLAGQMAAAWSPLKHFLLPSASGVRPQGSGGSDSTGG